MTNARSILGEKLFYCTVCDLLILPYVYRVITANGYRHEDPTECDVRALCRSVGPNGDANACPRPATTWQQARRFGWLACEDVDHRRMYYQCDGVHLLSLESFPLRKP